jgi:hypothetical protein
VSQASLALTDLVDASGSSHQHMWSQDEQGGDSGSALGGDVVHDMTAGHTRARTHFLYMCNMPRADILCCILPMCNIVYLTT